MECDHGTLVLEPYIKTGGPTPKWKISCNSSKSVYINCTEWYIYTCYIIIGVVWCMRGLQVVQMSTAPGTDVTDVEPPCSL